MHVSRLSASTLFRKEDDPNIQYLSERAVCSSNGVSETIPVIREIEMFSSNTVIENCKSNILYVPTETNRLAVDFVMPPWAFQATIAKTHTAKKLDAVLNQFPKETEWKLCFIIPEGVFQDFKFPRVTSEGRVIQKYKVHAIS